MRFGYFNQKSREYIITRWDTPTPWINYIGKGRYGGIISNTGGGYSFDRDPQNKRITRYRYNNLPMDRPGRYIYIKDTVTGEYWNPGFQPVQRKLDNYLCRHGMGYTVLEGEYNGITAEVTYFVPDDQNFEIWLLKVKNNRNIPRCLQIFTYSEFCFWDAIIDQQNVDWAQQINQGRYKDGIITWYPHEHERTGRATFFATGAPINSFDTNLETFIGKYRSESNPIAVEQGACSNSISHRMNGVGAFCLDLNLQPKEEQEIVFILGCTEDRANLKSLIQDYLTPQAARQALARLKGYWEDYLDKFQAELPDDDLNLFFNIWNQYQCKVTCNWSRFVSLYQLGLGRGMGFRDNAQDLLGVMHTIPEEVKPLLVKLLRCLFPDGRAYHLYFPLLETGGFGDAPIKKFDWYSDDHLWIILAITDYLKETGDFDFLDSIVAYADKQTEGSVWEHMVRALAFTDKYRGPHQLALAGRADWNDTLNLDLGNGIAESVFTSMLYCRALLDMGELCNYLGKKEDAAKYQQLFEEMKEIINKTCWDGEWYKRAFDDNGKPLGSKECESGKIFINSQSWAILGEIASPEYAKLSLASVEKHLNTKYGAVAVYPAYPYYDPAKGGITTFPPGTKENGGIFLQTNPWVMMAHTMMGDGEKAFQYYKQILPIYRNDDAENFEMEPYVYCQNILGKEHPQFGIGRNSWLTGTASWNFVAISQYILGIRHDYDSLIVDPCVPSTWKRFTAKRVFRGATYLIEVQNPRGVNKGVAKITVDGTEVAKIPIFATGTTHQVTVVMG
ncbi:MAG TPA: glycosyl transferase, partial [Bacillota bacterium]|nr:glycosyl transferase [Bacillota bacterium]